MKLRKAIMIMQDALRNLALHNPEKVRAIFVFYGERVDGMGWRLEGVGFYDTNVDQVRWD